MTTALRRLYKHLAFTSYRLFDHVGIHVLPKHYYSPVPDHKWLLANKALWMHRVPLTGIHWDLDQQCQWVHDVCDDHYAEVATLEVYDSCTSSGPGYGPIESQLLHCFIRKLSPQRIIEVGSGASTCCIQHAIQLNFQDGKPPSRIFSIEPFPYAGLATLPNVHLIPLPCQEVDAQLFSTLNEGDLLFIDSTHSVRTGSDVVRLFTEVIPTLQEGVYIHIHDIFLPYLYSRTALDDFFGWQETTLLLALMINNPKLRVLASLSALHYDRQPQLRRIFRSYKPQSENNGLADNVASSLHFPCSIWLQTC